MAKFLSNKEIDLTTGHLVPKLIVFTLPLMLTSVLQLMFNAADLIVVGQFSPTGGEDLAAIGGTGALINLIVNMFMGLSVGASVYTAQYIGAGDKKRTEETVHTSILVALIGGIICFFIGFFFSGTFLRWMGTIESVHALATLYMKIYFFGIPATLIYNFGAAILRAAGDTAHPLIFLTISGVANVILNVIMVVCFKKSVDGVAIATAISQYIAAGLVLWYLAFKSEGALKLHFSKLKIHKRRLLEMLKLGIPAGIQGSLFAISNVIIQSAVNSFDSAAVVTGTTTASNIEGFIYMSMNAFHYAALSFIGQCVGAKKTEKIGKIMWTCTAMSMGIGAILGTLALVFAKPLMGLYLGEDTQNAMQYGIIRMSVISATYYLCGFMDVLSGALRGMGSSLAPTLICLSGVCGTRILWIYTVFQKYHELKVLYYSYPISWVFSIVGQLILFYILKTKMKKKSQPLERVQQNV